MLLEFELINFYRTAYQKERENVKNCTRHNTNINDTFDFEFYYGIIQKITS